MTKPSQTREAWAKAAIDLIAAEIVQPCTAIPKPLIRVSVAMLSAKVLGECYPRSRSADNHNEIFIAAHTADSMLHLATLAHEIIHAYDDNKNGHRGPFATLARKIGLEGKLTATVVHEGTDLHAQLSDIHALLGDIPHAEISNVPKDKGNRNGYKIECGACGFKANTSKKWASRIYTGFACPVCDDQTTTTVTNPE